MKTIPRRPRALRELQRWFAAGIIDPALLARAESELVLQVPPGADIVQRMRVHADGYPARVGEALAESFPAVVHLLGKRRAQALTRRYLAASPPRTYNLNEIGARLPKFLIQDPLAAELPFLADLAELEWRVVRAFHAAQRQPLKPARPAALSAEQWSRARLRFQRGVAVVRSEWPIADLRAARDTPVEAIDIGVRERPQNVLVRRAGFEVACDLVGDGEAAALTDLLTGHPLGRVMERLASAEHEPDAVRAWFARWMSRGLIVGCSVCR
jgi:hypothetical protein